MTVQGDEVVTQIAPEVELCHACAEPAGEEGDWNIGFVLSNRGADLLELLSARLPHGQFRANEQTFPPATRLAPGECFRFDTRVRCHEPFGLVTENAFVIFLVQWRRAEWRIFARLRVVVTTSGTPAAFTVSITTQKVGFSGVAQ